MKEKILIGQINFIFPTHKSMSTRNLQVLIEELGNLILLRSRGNQKGLKLIRVLFHILLDIEFCSFGYYSLLFYWW